MQIKITRKCLNFLRKIIDVATLPAPMRVWKHSGGSTLMKIPSAFASALALALSVGSAHATQFITNGDFSGATGKINGTTVGSGWTSTGYNFVFSDGSVKAGGIKLWTEADGGANTWNGLTVSGTGNFAALDGKYQTGPIKETVTGLTVGKTYELTFDYAFSQQYGYNGATIQSLAADIGGVSWDSGDFNVANHGFSGWQSAKVTFTATSASEVLSFLATGNLPVPPFALVSDVSLTAAVPELSTWAMMLVGFAGLGFVGYRRGKNRAVA
jgi:hypothetical protein